MTSRPGRIQPQKELVCFTIGKFTFAQNLAFRIIAVSYDFAMMIIYATMARDFYDPCSKSVRQGLKWKNEAMSVKGDIDKKIL